MYVVVVFVVIVVVFVVVVVIGVVVVFNVVCHDCLWLEAWLDFCVFNLS